MVPGVIWVLPVPLVKPRGPTPTLVDGFQPVSEHGQLVLVLLSKQCFPAFPGSCHPFPVSCVPAGAPGCPPPVANLGSAGPGPGL